MPEFKTTQVTPLPPAAHVADSGFAAVLDGSRGGRDFFTLADLGMGRPGESRGTGARGREPDQSRTRATNYWCIYCGTTDSLRHRPGCELRGGRNG